MGSVGVSGAIGVGRSAWRKSVDAESVGEVEKVVPIRLREPESYIHEPKILSGGFSSPVITSKDVIIIQIHTHMKDLTLRAIHCLNLYMSFPSHQVVASPCYV